MAPKTSPSKLQKRTASDSVETRHNCGACSQSFGTLAEYMSHVCPQTNHKPTEIEHQDALTGGNFSRISKASLARGTKRKGEKTHPSTVVQKEAEDQG